MSILKIYKTHKDIVLPKIQTELSACFDIAFQSAGKTTFTYYNEYNSKVEEPLPFGEIIFRPGSRVMVPTGLIFDIEPGYSVRIHPRSGIALKQGLTFANCEAVIDADYVDETFLLIYTLGENLVQLKPGDRLAQGELVKNETLSIEERYTPPEKKSSREGGLGSTGVGATKLPSSLTSLLNGDIKELVSYK